MKYILLIFIFGFGACFLTSCATEVEEEEAEAVVNRDKLVARVSSVNVAANYVLIQRYGRLDVPENSVLYTLGSGGGGGGAASIKITGERLGQFLAADIVSGVLNVGDAVYLRVFDEVGGSDSQESLISR